MIFRLPRITILFGDPPGRPSLFAPYWSSEEAPMATQALYVPMSPVNPTDNVTGRTMVQTDAQGNSTTFLLDPTATVFANPSADDSLAPYTFVLTDANSVGNSLPSAPVTLGPPSPPPPPPPGGVPAQPVLGTPQWGTPPSGPKTVDLRSK